jgi:hypothetical protein
MFIIIMRGIIFWKSGGEERAYRNRSFPSSCCCEDGREGCRDRGCREKRRRTMRKRRVRVLFCEWVCACGVERETNYNGERGGEIIGVWD